MPFVFAPYLTAVRRSWRLGLSLNVKIKELFKRNVSTYIFKWMGIKVGIRFWGNVCVCGGGPSPLITSTRGLGVVSWLVGFGVDVTAACV